MFNTSAGHEGGSVRGGQAPRHPSVAAQRLLILVQRMDVQQSIPAFATIRDVSHAALACCPGGTVYRDENKRISNSLFLSRKLRQVEIGTALVAALAAVPWS